MLFYFFNKNICIIINPFRDVSPSLGFFEGSLNPLTQVFFSSQLSLSSVFFNLYALAGISMVGIMKKKDGVAYFNLIFKPVYALRKLLLVSFSIMNIRLCTFSELKKWINSLF